MTLNNRKEVIHLFNYYKNIFKNYNVKVYEEITLIEFNISFNLNYLIIQYNKEHKLLFIYSKTGWKFIIDDIYMIPQLIKKFIYTKNRFKIAYEISKKYPYYIEDRISKCPEEHIKSLLKSLHKEVSSIKDYKINKKYVTIYYENNKKEKHSFNVKYFLKSTISDIDKANIMNTSWNMNAFISHLIDI